MERCLALASGDSPSSLRAGAMLEAFYSSGIRRMELASLKVGDTDLSRGMLAIRRGKGGKDRFVPIGKRASGWIARYLSDSSLATTQVYDQLGRMTSKTDGDGTSTWLYDSSPWSAWKGFLFAEIGPRIGRSDGTTTFYHQNNLNYDHDELGRVAASHQFLDWPNNTSYYSTSYTFDSFGRPHQTTYPDGFIVENKYSFYGFLYQVKAAGGYAVNGSGNKLPGEVADNHIFWEADNHTARGMIDGYRMNGGIVSVDKTFDPVTGRLLTIKSGKGDSNSLMNHQYGYDVLGNVTRRQDFVNGEDRAATYGDLNRLTSFGSNTTTYDALGNIKTKSDGLSGTYSYGEAGSIEGGDPQAAAGPNAVTSIGGSKYTYDLNGNRVKGGGITLEWTPGNKLSRVYNSTGSIDANTQVALFWMGNSGQRFVQMDTHRNITHYVGALYEQSMDKDLRLMKKCYIMTPSGRVAVRTIKGTDGNPESLFEVQVLYMHQDGIGSIYAISDKDGDAFQRYTYNAWGEQTNTLDLSTQAGPREAVERGFTDHEMLADFGLIHMNGRVYDYTIGRFASADPFIDDAKDAESYNRYSYVNNSPLVYTDPSGYFKLKDVLKIVAVVVAAVVTGGAALAAITPGMGVMGGIKAMFAGGLLFGEAVAVGAGMGFGGGFSSSLLNGGSLGDAFKAGIVGAVVGGISAGIAHGIGTMFEGVTGSLGHAKHLFHGAAQGSITEAMGGEFRHGFASGFFSSAAGGAIMNKFGEGASGVVASAIVGGTASALGGGKFANGAISGAFTFMFNEAASHRLARSRQEINIQIVKGGGATDADVALARSQIREALAVRKDDGSMPWSVRMLKYVVSRSDNKITVYGKGHLARANAGPANVVGNAHNGKGDSASIHYVPTSNTLGGNMGITTLIHEPNHAFQINSGNLSMNIKTRERFAEYYTNEFRYYGGSYGSQNLEYKFNEKISFSVQEYAP